MNLHNHELVHITRWFTWDLSRCEVVGQGQVAVLGFRECMDLPVLVSFSRSRGPRAQRVAYPVRGHVQVAAHDGFPRHVVKEVLHGLFTRERRVTPCLGGGRVVHPDVDERTGGQHLDHGVYSTTISVVGVRESDQGVCELGRSLEAANAFVQNDRVRPQDVRLKVNGGYKLLNGFLQPCVHILSRVLHPKARAVPEVCV